MIRTFQLSFNPNQNRDQNAFSSNKPLGRITSKAQSSSLARRRQLKNKSNLDPSNDAENENAESKPKLLEVNTPHVTNINHITSRSSLTPSPPKFKVAKPGQNFREKNITQIISNEQEESDYINTQHTGTISQKVGQSTFGTHEHHPKQIIHLSESLSQKSQKTQNFGRQDTDNSPGLPPNYNKNIHTIVAERTTNADYKETVRSGTRGSEKKSLVQQKFTVTEQSIQDSSTATAEGPMRAVLPNNKYSPKLPPKKKRLSKMSKTQQGSKMSRDRSGLEHQQFRKTDVHQRNELPSQRQAAQSNRMIMGEQLVNVEVRENENHVNQISNIDSEQENSHLKLNALSSQDRDTKASEHQIFLQNVRMKDRIMSAGLGVSDTGVSSLYNKGWFPTQNSKLTRTSSMYRGEVTRNAVVRNSFDNTKPKKTQFEVINKEGLLVGRPETAKTPTANRFTHNRIQSAKFTLKDSQKMPSNQIQKYKIKELGEETNVQPSHPTRFIIDKDNPVGRKARRQKRQVKSSRHLVMPSDSDEEQQQILKELESAAAPFLQPRTTTLEGYFEGDSQAIAIQPKPLQVMTNFQAKIVTELEGKVVRNTQFHHHRTQDQQAVQSGTTRTDGGTLLGVLSFGNPDTLGYNSRVKVESAKSRPVQETVHCAETQLNEEGKSIETHFRRQSVQDYEKTTGYKQHTSQHSQEDLSKFVQQHKRLNTNKSQEDLNTHRTPNTVKGVLEASAKNKSQKHIDTSQTQLRQLINSQSSSDVPRQEEQDQMNIAENDDKANFVTFKNEDVKKGEGFQKTPPEEQAKKQSSFTTSKTDTSGQQDEQHHTFEETENLKMVQNKENVLLKSKQASQRAINSGSTLVKEKPGGQPYKNQDLMPVAVPKVHTTAPKQQAKPKKEKKKIAFSPVHSNQAVVNSTQQLHMSRATLGYKSQENVKMHRSNQAQVASSHVSGSLRKSNLHHHHSSGSRNPPQNKLSLPQLEMMAQGTFIPIFLSRPISEGKSPAEMNKTLTPPPPLLAPEEVTEQPGPPDSKKVSSMDKMESTDSDQTHMIKVVRTTRSPARGQRKQQSSMVHLQLIAHSQPMYSRHESDHETRKSSHCSRGGRVKARKPTNRQKMISPPQEDVIAKSPQTLGQTLNASSVYISENDKKDDDSPRKNGSIRMDTQVFDLSQTDKAPSPRSPRGGDDLLINTIEEIQGKILTIKTGSSQRAASRDSGRRSLEIEIQKLALPSNEPSPITPLLVSAPTPDMDRRASGVMLLKEARPSSFQHIVTVRETVEESCTANRQDLDYQEQRGDRYSYADSARKNFIPQGIQHPKLKKIYSRQERRPHADNMPHHDESEEFKNGSSLFHHLGIGPSASHPALHLPQSAPQDSALASPKHIVISPGNKSAAQRQAGPLDRPSVITSLSSDLRTTMMRAAVQKSEDWKFVPKQSRTSNLTGSGDRSQNQFMASGRDFHAQCDDLAMKEEFDSELTSQHRLVPSGEWLVTNRFPAKDTLTKACDEIIGTMASQMSSGGKPVTLELTKDQLMVTGTNFHSSGRSPGKNFKFMNFDKDGKRHGRSADHGRRRKREVSPFEVKQQEKMMLEEQKAAEYQKRMELLMSTPEFQVGGSGILTMAQKEMILSCYHSRQIEYIQFQQLVHYNREIQRMQQAALFAHVNHTENSIGLDQRLRLDHAAVDQSMQCAFEPIPAMELAPMAPEMRTTSMADRDSQVNIHDTRGSSIVVNLTHENNYPEGATLQSSHRPNSAAPASNRSKISSNHARKLTEKAKKVQQEGDRYSTLSLVRNNPQIYVQNDEEEKIPEAEDTDHEILRRSRDSAKRGYSAGNRRIPKAKKVVTSPDAASNGLQQMHASMGKIGKERTASGRNRAGPGRRTGDEDMLKKFQTSQASADCSTRKLHNSDIDLVHFMDEGSQLAKIPLQITNQSRASHSRAVSRQVSKHGFSSKEAHPSKSNASDVGDEALSRRSSEGTLSSKRSELEVPKERRESVLTSNLTESVLDQKLQYAVENEEIATRGKSEEKSSGNFTSCKDTLLMNDDRITLRKEIKKIKSTNVTRNSPTRSRKEKTVTEVSQSVEVLHPRFGDSRLNRAQGSEHTPLGLMAIKRNIPPLTSQAEKQKLRMSHSKVFKELGTKLKDIMPKNLQLMRQRQLLTNELEKQSLSPRMQVNQSSVKVLVSNTQVATEYNSIKMVDTGQKSKTQDTHQDQPTKNSNTDLQQVLMPVSNSSKQIQKDKNSSSDIRQVEKKQMSHKDLGVGRKSVLRKSMSRTNALQTGQATHGSDLKGNGSRTGNQSGADVGVPSGESERPPEEPKLLNQNIKLNEDSIDGNSRPNLLLQHTEQSPVVQHRAQSLYVNPQSAQNLIIANPIKPEAIFDVGRSSETIRFNKSSRLNSRVEYLFQGPLVRNVGQVNRAQNIPVSRLIHQNMIRMVNSSSNFDHGGSEAQNELANLATETSQVKRDYPAWVDLQRQAEQLDNAAMFQVSSKELIHNFVAAQPKDSNTNLRSFHNLRNSSQQNHPQSISQLTQSNMPSKMQSNMQSNLLMAKYEQSQTMLQPSHPIATRPQTAKYTSQATQFLRRNFYQGDQSSNAQNLGQSTGILIQGNANRNRNRIIDHVSFASSSVVPGTHPSRQQLKQLSPNSSNVDKNTAQTNIVLSMQTGEVPPRLRNSMRNSGHFSGSLHSGDHVLQHDDSTYVSVPSNMASYRGNEPEQDALLSKQQRLLSPKYAPKAIISGVGTFIEQPNQPKSSQFCPRKLKNKRNAQQKSTGIVSSTKNFMNHRTGKRSQRQTPVATGRGQQSMPGL